MAAEDHKKLVGVIRTVHENLKKALALTGDHEKVWKDHLLDVKARHQYSRAMFQLATEFWTKKESRIEWTHQTCLDYFYNGGLEKSIRRENKINKINHLKQGQDLSDTDCKDSLLPIHMFLNRKLRLLDVGSCYNPFSKYEGFSSVAIDLTPCSEEVLECDFLEIDIKSSVESSTLNCQSPHTFYENSFDIVVFSLVLEYLPSPKQRAKFFFNSWKLLRENGLCVIVTPDSKSVNHNAHMMKSWKLALEKIGFIRIKYEKLQHLHCMAFRKSTNSTCIANCDRTSLYNLLFIPQDFKDYTERQVSERDENENLKIYSGFLELPAGDLFD